MQKFLRVFALALGQVWVLVRGRRERSERGGRSHAISNWELGNTPESRGDEVRDHAVRFKMNSGMRIIASR